MSGLRKAAILLVLLGEEASSAIYNCLTLGELQRLTQEIADLNYISTDLASGVLKEYHQLTLTQDYLAQGGPEYANKLLVKALGFLVKNEVRVWERPDETTWCLPR